MRFYFPQYLTDRARFQTYTIVCRAMTDCGHVLVDAAPAADVVLFSMCDVTEYPGLVRLRKSTDRPILVGGSFAYNFKSALLYADAVWVGEVYEMAACRDLDAILAHPSCYTGGSLPSASSLILWPQVPVCRIGPHKCYYWGGQGCKGKCAFCFTSWTHPHQRNSPERIEAARRVSVEHKLHLMISSNEYDKGDGGKTQDMLLRDFLRVPVSGSMVRMGVEFATEATRRQMGKPISNADLSAAIAKAAREGISLRLFHIGGYDNYSDWDDYIELLAGAMERVGNARFVHLMFNNLQYQNYTPLFRRRRDIDPSRYLSIVDTKRYYDRLRASCSHVLVGAPSPFQHVACRMGVELSTCRGQVDWWLRMLRDAKHKLTVEQAYQALFDSGIMDTPELRLDLQTGVIREMPAASDG